MERKHEKDSTTISVETVHQRKYLWLDYLRLPVFQEKQK